MKFTLLFMFMLRLGMLPVAQAAAVPALRRSPPTQPAQTGPGSTPSPAAQELPVKAVPLSGHQPKPQRIDDGLPPDRPNGPARPNRARHADRPGRHAHGMGMGMGLGHGRRH